MVRVRFPVRFPVPICCRVKPHLCVILSASSISPRFLNRRFIIGRKEGKSSCAYLLRNLGDEQQVKCSYMWLHTHNNGAVARPSRISAIAGFPRISELPVRSKISSTTWKASPM